MIKTGTPDLLLINDMKKITFLPLLLLVSCQTLWAQSDKLSWRLAGRFHLDGVGYVNAPDTLSHQLDLVDLRLGAKISMGDWYVNIDASYAGNKISIKDAFVQYSKHDNYFRLGHQYVFTGIEEPNSSNDMLFNAISSTGSLLDSGRRLGFTYTRAMPNYYFTAGAFMGDDINVKGTVEQGYSAVFRGIWRPVNQEYGLLHVGGSAYYKVPNKDKETKLRNITLSNRGVVRAKGPNLHYLSIDNVNHQTLLSAEVIGIKNKWMLQGEYYWTRIDRVDAVAYQAKGGYVQAGYLIRGEHYGYDQVDAFPTCPTDKGSLLLLARYNNSNMNHEKSALNAGNQQDVTVGLDYFFNKNLSTRLGYSYVKLDEHSTIGKDELHVVQCRVQFKF